MIWHYFFKKTVILYSFFNLQRHTSMFPSQKGDFCGTLYKSLEVWRDAAALVMDRRGH